MFKLKGKLSALSNNCSHQGGPVGAGKVVLGRVICQWHGYQYRLEDGSPPPPFRERIHKDHVRLEGSRILFDPVALPLGTIAPGSARYADDLRGGTLTGVIDLLPFPILRRATANGALARAVLLERQTKTGVQETVASGHFDDQDRWQVRAPG